MSLRLAVHRHKSATLAVAELQLMRRLCADSDIQNRYMACLLKRALEMSAQALAGALESRMIYLHSHRMNNVRFHSEAEALSVQLIPRFDGER